jgi:hypothetical protein
MKMFAIVAAIQMALTSPTIAQSSPAIDAAKRLIDQAKQCDQDAALGFAKLSAETADTIAAGAFDKCLDGWRDASKASIDAQTPPMPSKAEQTANPFLLSSYLMLMDGMSRRNSVEA